MSEWPNFAALDFMSNVRLKKNSRLMLIFVAFNVPKCKAVNPFFSVFPIWISVFSSNNSTMFLLPLRTALWRYDLIYCLNS